MDVKKERRKIYMRCFALLLALWLALISVFTWHLRKDARFEERLSFISLAQSAQELFTNSCKAPEAPLTDSSWQDAFDSWQDTVSRWENAGFTAALFTYEGELVWSPQDSAIWTVHLSKGTSDWKTAAFDPARWFDINALSREMDKLKFSRYAELILEDVLLTKEGEVVPRTMLLRYNYETVATFTNSSYDLYEGELYPRNFIEFPVDVQESVEAVVNREDIQKLQDITANSTSLLEMKRDPGNLFERDRAPRYTIDQDVTYIHSWDALDRAFVTVVGFGRVVKDTWKANDGAIPVSYAHPTYWLVIAGRSDVWGRAGSYWLSSVFISLLGFLAAAWLLSHMSWKGQKARLLYEHRTRETVNAIAHNMKTPMSVLHACAENLEADICPEKQSAYITEITRQTEAMDQVLLDLLGLAAEERNA